MKIRALIFVCLLTSAVASWATGGCRTDHVTTTDWMNRETPIAGAKVLVCAESDTQSPCTALPLFSDSALTQPIDNPITTDGKGRYGYCGIAAVYKEYITGQGIAPRTEGPISVATDSVIVDWANPGPMGDTSVQSLNSIPFADRFVDVNVPTQIKDASDSCSGTSCVVAVPSSLGSGFATNVPTTTTCLDYRPQTYVGNPVFSGISITDCNPLSQWLTLNTGGLGNPRFVAAQTDPSGTYPGYLGALFFVNAFGGTIHNVDDGSVSIIQSQNNTDSLSTQAMMAGHEAEGVYQGTGLKIHTMRGIQANVLCNVSCSGQGGEAADVVAQAPFNIPASNFSIQRYFGVHAEDPSTSLSQAQQTCAGTYSTSGTVATWISGCLPHAAMVGYNITFGGVNYTVSSVNVASKTITASSSIGTNASIAMGFVGNAYAAQFDGNTLFNLSGSRSDTLGGGGAMFLTNGTGGNYNAIVIADSSQGHNADGTLPRMSVRFRAGSGFGLQVLNQAFTTVVHQIQDDGHMTVMGGIVNNGTGFQHKRVTSCTTAASIGATCGTTVTWGTAFADANYTVNCNIVAPNQPAHMTYIGSPIAASVVPVIAADTANATSGTIDCQATHD